MWSIGRGWAGVREINRVTGVHRSIMRTLAEIATTQGWLDPDRELAPNPLDLLLGASPSWPS